jgi:hypothetical protein
VTYFSTPPDRGLKNQYASAPIRTVQGTTAETTIVPTGVGTLAVPADYFRPGANARIVARGMVTTPLVAGTATFKIKLGGQTLLTASSAALLGNLGTPQSFRVICNIQCDTAGVNGKVNTGGEVGYPSGSAGNVVSGSLPLNASGLAVNTTVELPVDVTVQFTNAAVTLTTTIFTLELMNAY